MSKVKKLPTPQERPDLYDDYDCRPKPVGPISPEARDYNACIFAALSKHDLDEQAKTSPPDVET